jgi:ketosteroid isomerase-like protein
MIIFFSAFGCEQRPANALTDQEAKAILDRYMETMNKNDLALVDEIFADEFVLPSPFFPEPTEGKEPYKALVTSTTNTFSEFKATIGEIVVKGDKVWGRFFDGRHKYRSSGGTSGN